MPLDPFAMPDPFGAPPLPRQQQQQLPPLTPAEQSSLLEKIGSAGLGGLSFLGGILNKPGRIVRGALGGHFDELGNVIPFSDALGITSPEREVRGTDILRNLGVHDEQDPSLFSAAGAAGFGVDLLTDPLTYLSFGGHALSKAGIAAKKAGTLPATVAERAAAGLGGHIGIGLPFGGNAATADLAPLGNAIAGGVRKAAGFVPGGNAALDTVGNAASGLGDLYNRTIPPLFQKSALGQTDPAAQSVARELSAELPGVQAGARRKVMNISSTLPEAGLTQQGGRDIRVGLESLDANSGPFESAINGQRGYQQDLLQRANHQGLPDLPLSDEAIGFAPRQATIATKSERSAMEASMRPSGQLPARQELLKGLPTEGTGSINDLTRREDLLPMRQAYKAGDKAPLENIIKKDYLKVDDAELIKLRNQAAAAGPSSMSKEEYGSLVKQFGKKQADDIVSKAGGGFSAPPDMDRLATLEAHAKQAENLANWVATSVPEDLAKNGLGFFDRHPHVDLMEKAVRDETRILKASKLYQAVAKMAAVDPSGVPLADVLKNAGLTFTHEGKPVAMSRMLEALQAEGKLPAGTLDNFKNLEGLSIPRDQVSRVAKFTQAATSPAGLKPVLDIIDSATNLTKSFQTALWPANWVRNQTQAMFQNFVHDAYNAHVTGPMSYVKPLVDAKAWRDGGVISGASKYPGFEHLTDEAATKVLQKEISAFNVHSAFRGPEADIIGGDLATRKLLPDMPGEARKGFGDILKQYPTGLTKPTGVAGVGENLVDTFGPVKAGRELNQELHAVDRVSTYLAKRSQGFTPEAALKEVNLAHYDFTNVSQFEKGVMQRIVPFYNFARQNVPAVLTEIAENPGGKMATALKGTLAARGEHPGFLRGDLQQGIAAPIGGEENGQQRYLNHLGLGFEDLGRMDGAGLLGMLNPLIKAPIEQATGKQLFTGRDLRDLHSRVGDLTGTPLPLGENLLMNSPLGRVVSTASTLADPRKTLADKAVNTLTGARLTDVDVEGARRNAVRDYIAEQMHGPGISQYSDFAVKPENMPMLSPLQQQLFQMHRQLNARRPAPLPSF